MMHVDDVAIELVSYDEFEKRRTAREFSEEYFRVSLEMPPWGDKTSVRRKKKIKVVCIVTDCGMYCVVVK